MLIQMIQDSLRLFKIKSEYKTQNTRLRIFVEEVRSENPNGSAGIAAAIAPGMRPLATACAIPFRWVAALCPTKVNENEQKLNSNSY